MTGALQDRTALVVGRGSGIARVVVAGRDEGALRESCAGEPGIRAETVDVTDDDAIAALGERLGTLDHIVSTASSRARGTVADLQRDAVRASLDTKVVGPLMLAEYLGPRISRNGSMFRVTPGTAAVALTNGAADTLTRSPAVELAPVRGNAVSPGTIDTGARDAPGEPGRAALFADRSARNPARRIGRADDVARVALFALTTPFRTGATLPADGGEALV